MAYGLWLARRTSILRGIREFFWARNFLEVETPVMLAHPSQEPYLEPLRTTFHDERGRAHDGFLRMSPEFSLKKMIAALASSRAKRSGAEGSRSRFLDSRGSLETTQCRSVFEIGPIFRDGEPWGGAHNPEFTMLEWYEVGADYRKLMTTCEELVGGLIQNVGAGRSPSRAEARDLAPCTPRGRPLRAAPTFLSYQGQSIALAPPWERLTMRAAWERYASIDLDRLLTRAAMARACRSKGYTVTRGDTFDDLFFKIHLTEVEPKIGRSRPTFLLDWPVQMAALARRKPRDSRYAERVELYIGGLEIANGFSELTDADEQLARFRADQRLRRRIGRSVYPIDREFIAALRRLPQAAGMALGVDRLVMLLTDAATIDDVRWLPATDLFPT